METGYRYKGLDHHKGILHSVKEVDSNDSSVMSNQIRKNQNRQSSQNDKYQCTQNFSSAERKDSQVNLISEDNQFGKQEFTSSSKSSEMFNNPGNQLLRMTQLSYRNDTEQNNSDSTINDNLMQQKLGSQQQNNYSPKLQQRGQVNMNGNLLNDNNIQQYNGIKTNQQKSLSGMVTSNNQEYIQTSTETMLRDNQISQASIPSHQGSALVLMNENPNFLASHSPLILKKVRPSQWNNIPLMNLEQCESNTNFNIQDISMIHQNPSGSDHPSPQKEESLTKSEFLIYQCLPSPPNQLNKETSLQLPANKQLSSQSDPSSPTRVQNQNQQQNLILNINQIKMSSSNQSPQKMQLASNFLDFSNSPNNNSSNFPQGAISTFKDSLSPQSPTKQNDMLKQPNQQQQMNKLFYQQQQFLNVSSPQSQTNQALSNNPLPSLHPQASLYSFAASPTHFRSSVQLQQHQQQALQQQLTGNQIYDQNLIQSLQHINQNFNSDIQQIQISSQASKTNEIADFSPQGLVNSNYLNSLKGNSVSGTNKSIQSQSDVAQQFSEVVQPKQIIGINQQNKPELIQNQSLQSPQIKGEQRIRESSVGSQSANAKKTMTSPKSDYKQREELAQQDQKRQSQQINQQYQEDFAHNQSHEIYSFNKNNSSHINNNNSESISPTTIIDSQPILMLNKQLSTTSNVTGQFKETTSLNQISDLQSSQNLDFPKQDNIQHQETNKVNSMQNSSKHKPSLFSTPYIVSEVNQKALTRSTTTSVRGEKFILAKSLQVKITKFYSDETIEVCFDGMSGIFMKKDFIFLKENILKKKEDTQLQQVNNDPKRRSSPNKQNKIQNLYLQQQTSNNIRSASLYLPSSSRISTSPPQNQVKQKQKINHPQQKFKQI